jgi:hypothetical protein
MTPTTHQVFSTIDDDGTEEGHQAASAKCRKLRTYAERLGFDVAQDSDPTET